MERQRRIRSIKFMVGGAVIAWLVVVALVGIVWLFGLVGAAFLAITFIGAIIGFTVSE